DDVRSQTRAAGTIYAKYDSLDRTIVPHVLQNLDQRIRTNSFFTRRSELRTTRNNISGRINDCDLLSLVKAHRFLRNLSIVRSLGDAQIVTGFVTQTFFQLFLNIVPIQGVIDQ